MERDLAEPVDEPRRPAGPRRSCAFDRAHDDAVRVAHNECFATHWGSSERIAGEWQQWFTGDRHFRPDLSFLVLDGDEVAAYTLCQRYPEEDEPHGYTSGWLGQLGTRRPWRGRGLGHLAAPPDRRGDAGRRPRPRRRSTSTAENATGALALYEREGFRATDPAGRLRRGEI